jgi:hypothetical protein
MSIEPGKMNGELDTTSLVYMLIASQCCKVNCKRTPHHLIGRILRVTSETDIVGVRIWTRESILSEVWSRKGFYNSARIEVS